MTPAIILAFVWALTANVLAMIPSKDNHWTRAYVLIAVGLPILAMVFWQNGPWVALLVLIAGLSILRWPLRYALRWLRQRTERR
ncbi:DUF2484 family protein [Pseudoprimorskyibacter insulae]|uniref:DUF2484 family protein n=1 Tax=Pseudoprimorskyibacter insulae TaxID=1695997 RepID=A0A2R8AWE0_9RHOB|nr:DUF2484 family protein [Pseudoprimorskyibacter insulae]SPF80355.1 hypothetical protein PRI8871_02160 [Pseudoprimorskyibacter insulae]